MLVGLHVKYRYSCPSLMKIEFSRQILEKYPNIKFHAIRPVGAELCRANGRTDGWTDRQDEGNSCLGYHVSHQERFRAKFRTEFVEFVVMLRYKCSQL